MRVPAESIAGVVLAGGKSSRMGQNKALLTLHGQPMIEIAAAVLREVFEYVCIVADDAAQYRFLGLPIFPDIIKHCGPLGGIHAGLVGCSRGAVFVLACDMPRISPDLVRFMVSRRSDAKATIARHSDHIHPLCGIYERSALPEIEQSLARSTFRLIDVLDGVDAAYVDITDDLPFYRADLFENINDPQTYNNSAADPRR